MSIKVNFKEDQVKIKDLKSGQFAVVTDDFYKNSIIFCTFGGENNDRVMFRNDGKVLIDGISPESIVNIKLLKSGDSFTITIP